MSMNLKDIVSELDRATDDLPNLDKDELESRLSDLESQARNLAEQSVESLPDEIGNLVDAIHELYTEV